jgi:hypothetical protein
MLLVLGWPFWIRPSRFQLKHYRRVSIFGIHLLISKINENHNENSQYNWPKFISLVNSYSNQAPFLLIFLHSLRNRSKHKIRLSFTIWTDGKKTELAEFYELDDGRSRQCAFTVLIDTGTDLPPTPTPHYLRTQTQRRESIAAFTPLLLVIIWTWSTYRCSCFLFVCFIDNEFELHLKWKLRILTK